MEETETNARKKTYGAAELHQLSVRLEHRALKAAAFSKMLKRRDQTVEIDGTKMLERGIKNVDDFLFHCLREIGDPEDPAFGHSSK